MERKIGTRAFPSPLILVVHAYIHTSRWGKKQIGARAFFEALYSRCACMPLPLSVLSQTIRWAVERVGRYLVVLARCRHKNSGGGGQQSAPSRSHLLYGKATFLLLFRTEVQPRPRCQKLFRQKYPHIFRGKGRRSSLETRYFLFPKKKNTRSAFFFSYYRSSQKKTSHRCGKIERFNNERNNPCAKTDGITAVPSQRQG